MEQHPEKKKAVGRPRLQYLKQVARNTEVELYSNEENGLQQFQMESCQPIKRFKDKKKKIYFNYCFIVFIRCYRWNFNANLRLPVILQLLESRSTM